MGRFIDISGKTFGMWEVKERIDDGSDKIKWICLCTGCGREFSVLGGSLRHSRSMGCRSCRSRHPYKEQPKHDLSGKKFHMLTAVSPVFIRKRWEWNCICECGGETIASGSDLSLGKRKSCGCLKARGGPDNPRWKGCGSISGHYWSQVKRGAEIRGLSFNLSIEEAWKILEDQEHKCALSGLEISFAYGRSKKRKGTTASLDRIDSSLGYDTSNVHWVHKDINQMKMDFPMSRFLYLCKLVAETKGD